MALDKERKEILSELSKTEINRQTALTALLFRFPFPGPWGEELTEASHDLARDIANEPGLPWGEGRFSPLLAKLLDALTFLYPAGDGSAAEAPTCR